MLSGQHSSSKPNGHTTLLVCCAGCDRSSTFSVTITNQVPQNDEYCHIQAPQQAEQQLLQICHSAGLLRQTQIQPLPHLQQHEAQLLHQRYVALFEALRGELLVLFHLQPAGQFELAV
jgi:hypothetical protein